MHPGQDGPDHSAAGGLAGCKEGVGNTAHEVVLPDVVHAVVIPLGGRHVGEGHGGGIEDNTGDAGRTQAGKDFVAGGCTGRLQGGEDRSDFHFHVRHGEAEAVLTQLPHRQAAAPDIGDGQLRQFIPPVRVGGYGHTVALGGIADVGDDLATVRLGDCNIIGILRLRPGVGNGVRVGVAAGRNHHAQRLGGDAGSRRTSGGPDGHTVDILAVNRLRGRREANGGDGIVQQAAGRLQDGADQIGNMPLGGRRVLIGIGRSVSVLGLHLQIAVPHGGGDDQQGLAAGIALVGALIIAIGIGDQVVSLGRDHFRQDIGAPGASRCLAPILQTGGSLGDNHLPVAVAESRDGLRPVVAAAGTDSGLGPVLGAGGLLDNRGRTIAVAQGRNGFRLLTVAAGTDGSL